MAALARRCPVAAASAGATTATSAPLRRVAARSAAPARTRSPRPASPCPLLASRRRITPPARFFGGLFGGGGGGRGGAYDDDDGDGDGYGEGDDFTVGKLQVGIFGPVARFQKELERIARILEGRDDDEAMAYVVREISILLSRKAKYCAYGAAALKFTPDLAVAERKFNSVALEERGKVRQETFSVRASKTSVAERSSLAPEVLDEAPDVGLDEWLCVTLVFCVEGRLNLGKVRQASDLQRALKVLGGVRSADVVAVELLWTPEAEGDHYSKDELLSEHPTLATL